MTEMGTLRTAIPINSTTTCEEFTRKSIRGIAQNKTRVNKSINLEEIGVNMKVGHTNEIEITDKIKMIMRYHYQNQDIKELLN